MSHMVWKLSVEFMSLALATTAAVGCHAGSVCNPPGSTSGTISAMESSDGLNQRAKSDGGVPYMGCSAQAKIPTTIGVYSDRWRDEQPPPGRKDPPGSRPAPRNVDSRVSPTKGDVSVMQGEIRV